MKKIILTAAMLLTFGSAANAACTRADLTGTWVVYSSGAYSYANRCQLIIPAKGDTFSASCFAANNSISNATVSITSFDKTCHLVSQFVSPTDTITVDAFVSKGKDSMSGMWVEYANGNTDSGSFNGSKQ